MLESTQLVQMSESRTHQRRDSRRWLEQSLNVDATNGTPESINSLPGHINSPSVILAGLVNANLAIR